ncbi:MAG: hypothetical protein AAFV51_11490, partial [Pseudomonadota bacterium]
PRQRRWRAAPDARAPLDLKAMGDVVRDRALEAGGFGAERAAFRFEAMERERLALRAIGAAEARR